MSAERPGPLAGIKVLDLTTPEQAKLVEGEPLAHLDRHIEIAKRVFGLLVEVAGAEEMATAGFDVISLHAAVRRGFLLRSVGW